MNLITEYREDSVEVITEAKDDGKKNYFIEGIFMQAISKIATEEFIQVKRLRPKWVVIKKNLLKQSVHLEN